MKLSILKRAIGGIAYEGIDAIDIPGRPVFDEAIVMAEYLLGRLEAEIKKGEVTDLDSPDYYRGMEELRFHVNAALDDCGAARGDDVGDRIRALKADAPGADYARGFREGREEVAQLFQDMDPDSPLNKQGAVGDVWLSLQVARLIRGGALLGGGASDGVAGEFQRGTDQMLAYVNEVLDRYGAAPGDIIHDRIGSVQARAAYDALGAVKGIVDDAVGGGSIDDGRNQLDRLRAYISNTKVDLSDAKAKAGRTGFEAGEREEQRRVCDAIASMGSHPRPYASDVLAAVIAEIKK